MSLFNTQKKKVGNATAGETKLPAKLVPAKAGNQSSEKKAVAKLDEKAKNLSEKRQAAAQGVVFPKGSAVIKPRVTEKAGLLAQHGVYTFDVRVDSNSRQIAQAITAAYKVVPVKVSVAAIKSKAMFVRGKKGKTVSGKKAYVYLKKGETIEFI